ncbi:MAG TPA: hypothetical protein VJT73_07540, partial [Polyangiaceae bacterium]|nr:hypothetical protein [Polyangiaceae bacterium]
LVVCAAACGSNANNDCAATATCAVDNTGHDGGGSAEAALDSGATSNPMADASSNDATAVNSAETSDGKASSDGVPGEGGHPAEGAAAIADSSMLDVAATDAGASSVDAKADAGGPQTEPLRCGVQPPGDFVTYAYSSDTAPSIFTGGSLTDGIYVMIAATHYESSPPAISFRDKDVLILRGNEYYWGQRIEGDPLLYATLGTFSVTGSVLHTSVRPCKYEGTGVFDPNSTPQESDGYFTLDGNLLTMRTLPGKTVAKFLKQ